LKIDDESITSKVYSLIRSEILTCSLKPGQQVSQAYLAKRFSTGTTPIRESLVRLAHEGYVKPVPRFGYVVSSITLADVWEIYEIRLILESAAIKLAITNASDEQLQDIANSSDFSYVYKNKESYLNFLDRNNKFHRSIALVSQNRRLAELVGQTIDELTRFLHIGLEFRNSAQERKNEHILLAESLLTRDSERSVRLMEEQIVKSKQRVIEAILNGSLKQSGSDSQINFGER
jgi:DNA-binding GntR family transcriptional regulator